MAVNPGPSKWIVRIKRLNRAETRIMRRMCEVSLSDRYPNAELRKRFDLDPVSKAVRRDSLQWYDHVHRKNEDG